MKTNNHKSFVQDLEARGNCNSSNNVVEIRNDNSQASMDSDHRSGHIRKYPDS